MLDLPDANSPQAESSDSEWERSEFQESDLQDSQRNDRGETGETSVLLEPELLALESELLGLGIAQENTQDREQDQAQENAQQAYNQGQRAFETGRYREAIDHLEAASGWTEPSTELGGEIQVWLVTAYEALGLRDQALALCRQACRHRSLTVRQSARRLLTILEAPQLSQRPDWITPIPDLTNLDAEAGGPLNKVVSRSGPRPTIDRSPLPAPLPPPVNPEDVAAADRQNAGFLWLAGGLAIAFLLVQMLL